MIAGICICRQCARAMAPGSERPPSAGNPNVCVPCATGHDLPAEGSAVESPKDGAPTPKQSLTDPPFPDGRWGNRE